MRAEVARDGLYFIDVGANIGDWTAALQQLSRPTARFVAYEPSRSAFDPLKLRFAETESVLVREVAIGDEPGTQTLFEEPDAGKGSSFVPGFLRTSGAERSVSVTTLDLEIDRLQWPWVDLVKIDAEGYDFRVLRGAHTSLRAHRMRLIQFEYNRSWQLAGNTLFGAFAYLKEAGYETYLLKREGLFRLNYRLYEEYFEYSNYVAVSPDYLPRMQPFVKGTI